MCRFQDLLTLFTWMKLCWVILSFIYFCVPSFLPFFVLHMYKNLQVIENTPNGTTQTTINNPFSHAPSLGLILKLWFIHFLTQMECRIDSWYFCGQIWSIAPLYCTAAAPFHQYPRALYFVNAFGCHVGDFFKGLSSLLDDDDMLEIWCSHQTWWECFQSNIRIHPQHHICLAYIGHRARASETKPPLTNDCASTQSNLIPLWGSVDFKLGNWPSGRHQGKMMNWLLFEDE